MKPRSTALLLAGALTLLAVAPAAGAGLGPPHDAFYVDGDVYRTIGTPTDLTGSGAPAHTYDTLYAIEGQALAVAEAKPGDRDYNGGRWMRFPVTWNVTPYQDPLTSEEDVLEAARIGDVTIAPEPDAQFVCPVIRGT
jgi:hypothetical protein